MRFIVTVLYDAYLKFSKDDGWAISSHLALSILTSMFPFLIFVTALGGFFGNKAIADQATQLLFDAWPPRVAEPIAKEIHNVLTQPRSGLLTLGGVLAIYFSASGVEALRIGLDRAYDVQDNRSWWLLRLEAILFVFLGALALLSFAFLLVFAPLVWAWARQLAPAVTEPLEHLYAPVRFGVTTAIFLLVMIICHKYLPAGRRSITLIWPGVFLTLLAWMGFGVAFGFYLANYAGNYVSTYAGLASIMIALVFLYWLSALLLFGAELNQAIRRLRRRPATAAPLTESAKA
jgi:membrane protein